MSNDIICELCGILVDGNKYNLHLRLEHKKQKQEVNKKEFVCETCHKTFTSLYNLQYHLAHHVNARDFLCSECPRKYNTAADLAQHQRVHEKQREPFKCEECNLTFPIRSRFKTHMNRTHKKENKDPKECPICNKKFVSLSNHNRIVHMNLRNYECSICLKRFGKKSGLNRHVLTVHEKQKNFNCNLCNKAFGEKGQLTKHMRIHSVVEDISYCSNHGTFKSFFCDFCKKGFAEKIQLKRHMKIHEEKSTRIELKMIDCNFKDDQQVFLKIESVDEIEKLLKLEDSCDDEVFGVERKRMKSIIDSNDKNIKCNLCHKKFKSKKRLQEHFDDIHFLINENIDEVEAFEQEQTVRKLVNMKPFQCDQCEKSFNKIHHLHNHLLARHSEKKFKCYDCNRSFSYKSALDRHHKIVHRKQKHHVCCECGWKFASNFDLRQHFEGHHNESTKAERTCAFCDKIFTKERNLKYHIQAIHNKSKFECEICLKTFSFKSAKERHLKVVHYNQKSHQCSICEKSFGTRYDLRNHFDHYHNENDNPGRYHCEECDKNFLSSSTLSRHQKGVHEHIKIKSGVDYKCKICHEIFSNKYQKEKHMAQVHLYGKKLTRTCKLCELEFQFYDEYKTHIESHADNFICIICGDYFKDHESFVTHTEGHKKIEIQLRKFTCDICEHRLFNKIQLQVHMRKHMQEKNFYVCEICGQSYKFIAPFLYHKLLHEGTKEFICAYCSKEFVRKQDLLIHCRQHTNQKPFKCRVCFKCFSHKQVLTNHLQTHSTTRVIFNCSDCNLEFIDKKQLRNHKHRVTEEEISMNNNYSETIE